MKPLRIGIVGLLLASAGVPALAERIQVLFQLRNWVVEGVTSDDGSYSCHAKVALLGDSFSIKLLADRTTRLEFYSEEWDFGEGDTAVIEVEVDALAPRTFSGATLLQSSVFVDLPDPADSAKLMEQVARGGNLHLRAADGTAVRTYSLSGSRSAISNLDKCDQRIVPDRNPFN